MLKYEIIQKCTHAMICNPLTTNFVTKPHFALANLRCIYNVFVNVTGNGVTFQRHS